MLRRLSIWVLVVTLIAAGGTLLAQEENPSASSVFTFPDDHLLHPDDPLMDEHYIEWHYFTGILTDSASGAVYGYQVTLFTRVVRNELGFVYDVAISDLQNSAFLHYRGIGGNPEISVSSQLYEDALFSLSLQDDQWIMRFQGDAEIVSTGQRVPLQLELTATNDKQDYYLHVPGGISAMGTCAGDVAALDGYTYYYSHPALTTSGSLTIGQNAMTVSGDTWFDHQWGNFMHCHLAWNWFSLRLEDGSYIMLFQLLDESGLPLGDVLGATYIQSDGTVDYWLGEDTLNLIPQRTWTNPRTKVPFVLGWQVETPIGTFNVDPVFDDQTPSYLPPLPYYWEGVIEIRDAAQDGQWAGLGYLEVVPVLPN